MVGRIFRVIFTRYAQRRRQQIFDFEKNLNGKKYAQKVQKAIDKEAKNLEDLPESNPYLYEITNKRSFGTLKKMLMSAVEMQTEVHQMLDELDEHFLKVVHSMMSTYETTLLLKNSQNALKNG